MIMKDTLSLHNRLNIMSHLFKSIVTGIILILSYASEAAYYRWVDSKGVIHYSSSVPPSVAQKGHTELNKNGLTKATVISSKKKKELKKEKERLIIKRKLEEKLRKEKAKQEEEEIRLLSIYSTEEEVTKAYNSRLRMAQLTIDLLKSRHKKQAKKIEVLERRKERSKTIKFSQVVEKRIEESLDNLSIYQQAITENVIEKDRVRKEYKSTLSRFKKLLNKQAQR